MSEHRPTVTLQVDIFPEDSFMLDEEDCPNEDCLSLALGVPGTGECLCPPVYTPEQVAKEAWDNIGEWWQNGYLPIMVVTMPDGTEHTIDVERVAKGDLT